jgi:hypothetical protein
MLDKSNTHIDQNLLRHLVCTENEFLYYEDANILVRATAPVRKQEVLGRTNRLLSLIGHGPH